MSVPLKHEPGRPVVEILSKSPSETHRLGVRLARALPVPGVLLLRGSLGTGKTTLTRGVAEGLGLGDGSQVNSPSFTLVNIYEGECRIYHVDLYRLSGERDIMSTGLDEFLGREGVTIVEWSERLPYPLDSALEVELEDHGDDMRKIRIIYPATKQRGPAQTCDSADQIPSSKNRRQSGRRRNK